MALKINTSKLLADYEQAQQDLGYEREIHEADVRQRIQPYLEKGVLSESDVSAIVDKLAASDQKAFDSKWGVLKDYISDEPDNTEIGLPEAENTAEAIPSMGFGGVCYQNNEGGSDND